MILNKVAGLEAGSYIISHRIGAATVTVHRATSKEEGQQEGKSPAHSLDLEGLQEAAAKTTALISYIPKRWAGSSTQIPFTFPPKKAAKWVYPNTCKSLSRTGACLKPDVSPSLIISFFFFSIFFVHKFDHVRAVSFRAPVSIRDGTQSVPDPCGWGVR